MIIDMHRHFGGSITTKFVWNEIQKKGLGYLAETEQDVISAMTFAPHEQYGFYRFLQKFTILNDLKWDEESIYESIQDVSEAIRAENVRYTWMRFSINKYMETTTKHKEDIIRFIHNAFNELLPDRVGLILSLKYESLRANQKQYAKLIDSAAADCLIGIDLVGDEGFFDAGFYAPIFKEWGDAGKVLCAHVGESCSHENIREAILKMGVKQVAHGIKIVEDKELMAIAKDQDVCFDVALSSNLYTGCWTTGDHPIIKMMEYGLQVTVGTDDPVQLQTTMQKEYDLLAKMIGPDAVEECQNTAIQRTAKVAPWILKECLHQASSYNLQPENQGG